MQLEMTPYRILRWSCILCAGVICLLAWKATPPDQYPWISICWFVLFATLAELLPVNLADDSQGEVTPSSPIYWAATCVLGPMSAILVCVVSCTLAEVLAFLAFSYAHARSLAQASIHSPDGDGATDHAAPSGLLQQALVKIGRVWEPKVGMGTFKALESTVSYVAILVLIVGVSGVFYRLIGGRYLHGGVEASDTLRHFVLPFFGLVIAAIVVDQSLFLMAVAILDPIPGAKGIYGALLRMHVAVIETSLPVSRPQMFLALVSLMLSYLYVRVGPLGFVLTSLPTVALREFYSQWVQEQSAYLDTVSTLATYMQHYHPYTRGHLRRVAVMSERLARELRLPTDSIRRIGHAGLLHDIGKIGVSEEILDKTDKLDLEEWERIKSHPSAGAEIISHLDFLEGIVDWIKYHHKWHDGRGYPETSNGDVIPIEASIIAVADSFDAMTDDREMASAWVCDSCGYRPPDASRPEHCPKCAAAKRRVYRKPKTLDEAIDELRRGAGSQFHPEVVRAFLAMIERDGVHLDVG